MFAIVMSAVAVCASALMLGQAALRICGATRWTWLAAPVGLAVEMVITIPAIHVPGRASTTAVALGVLTVMSGAWVLRERSMRPPLSGLLAAVPVAALTMVPFAAAGHAGILGVSIENDTASHLALAEFYRSASAPAVGRLVSSYPLGPHAVAGTLAEGLGFGVQATLVGLTAAAVIVLAWTALAALVEPDRVGRLGQVFVATVVGMPFLVAAYYGQGSFKELIQAAFVLGLAAAVSDGQPRANRLRWVPISLLTAGGLSVYSVDALPWIVGLIGGVAVAGAISSRASPRAVLASARAAIAPSATAFGVLLVLLIPQLPRIARFISTDLSVNGSFIPTNVLGNLIGPLPFWEAFGTWDQADYRVAPADRLATGVWTALILALAVFGIVWSIRRREWALPVAAVVSSVIWIVSDGLQSPYVAAKGLVILAPIVILLAARPLVDRDPSLPVWWLLTAPVLAVVLVIKLVGASLPALRSASVGPTNHLSELRALRPLLDGKPTLFLGNDDFIRWELAGVPVAAPVIGIPKLPPKAPKQWVPGSALDIDSVQADAINAADWVITTRDAAASQMPPQLKLVRETTNYDLWRRTGTVATRDVLAEGDDGGAVLDCSSTAGRGILRGGGDALIRPASSSVAVPAVVPGATADIDVALAPGTYQLELSYTSPLPIDLQVVGHLETLIDANLDRPGPRWPVGRVTIAAGEGPLRITLHARKTWLAPATIGVPPSSIIATPAGNTRIVPIRDACGKYVDWYTPAGLG